jgi:tetratricopeptide (TPR) repeat protein
MTIQVTINVAARQLLASTYWGQYRAEDAVREIQTLATEEPQNEVIWSNLGGYLLAMGEFDRAQPALERFAMLAPDNANSYTLLGDSLRYQGDFDAAINQYEKALQIDPAMREVAASLATIDYFRGEYQQAEQGFAKIVNDESLIVSERLDAMFALQSLLAAKGDFTGADNLVELFSTELKQENIRDAMATSTRALLKLEIGTEAAARELATSAEIVTEAGLAD